MKRSFALALVLIAVGAAIVPQYALANCKVESRLVSRVPDCGACPDVLLPDRITETRELWYEGTNCPPDRWYETEYYCTLDWSCDHAR